MTPEKFRARYGALGVMCELLIAGVIVGNFTWWEAAELANALCAKFCIDYQI